jgi:hypothetical protein
MKDFMFIGGMFVVVFLFLGLSLHSRIYLEGSAKSDWLKQERNVDIPWYRAVFLDVEINDSDNNIKIR